MPGGRVHQHLHGGDVVARFCVVVVHRAQGGNGGLTGVETEGLDDDDHGGARGDLPQRAGHALAPVVGAAVAPGCDGRFQAEVEGRVQGKSHAARRIGAVAHDRDGGGRRGYAPRDRACWRTAMSVMPKAGSRRLAWPRATDTVHRGGSQSAGSGETQEDFAEPRDLPVLAALLIRVDRR